MSGILSRLSKTPFLRRTAQEGRLSSEQKKRSHDHRHDFFWQGQKGSNSRHAVLETAALPTELYPCVVGLRGLEPGTGRL